MCHDRHGSPAPLSHHNHTLLNCVLYNKPSISLLSVKHFLRRLLSYAWREGSHSCLVKIWVAWGPHLWLMSKWGSLVGLSPKPEGSDTNSVQLHHIRRKLKFWIPSWYWRVKNWCGKIPHEYLLNEQRTRANINEMLHPLSYAKDFIFSH